MENHTLHSKDQDFGELMDRSDETVTVDKRTFWFMVAAILVCVALLGVCVAFVLWKKVLCTIDI